MKKVFLLAWLLSFVIFSTLPAQTQHRDFPIDCNKKPVAIIGFEKAASLYPSVKPHSGNKTGALGPGMYLMTSYYDYGSNGGVLPNIVNYGDGTIAIARMGAIRPDTADLGSYWTYFDGIGWWMPMTKVDRFYGKAWSNLSSFADGRSVVAVHTGELNLGVEVSVDALKGFAVWTTFDAGNNTAFPLLWPRLTIDGADKVIICSSVNGLLDGIEKSKEVTSFVEHGFNLTHQILQPDTGSRTPQFSADDQAIDSFGNNTAIAVVERGGDLHLWETQDNGQTWTYRNLTNYSSDIPLGAQEIRPWDTCDLIYDKEGKLHIFWEAVRATQDTAGTAIELWHSREVGIQHWKEGRGIQQVVAWEDLPNAHLESDEDLFRAGDPFDQINADATLAMQPQAGFDRQGHLFLLFAAYRPLDFDADSTHFTDIYVLTPTIGDIAGGIINITDTPQSEDLWASLADNVDDSLRFVYQSDGNTGNSILGGGAAPTIFLYHAFSKYGFIEPRKEIVVSASTTPAGFPGGLVEVPVSLTLEDKRLSAFEAILEATEQPLSFVDFKHGPIDPDSTLRVTSLAPEKVRISFLQSGGAPIQNDGVLVTLRFRIRQNAIPGAYSELVFSNLFAREVNSDTLQVRGLPGRVTILSPPGEIHGTVWHDLNGNGERESNEPGLAGWQINLAGALLANVKTDSLGHYSFLSLNPGVYVISMSLQPGWIKTHPLGDHTFYLPPGFIATNIDFGNWVPNAGAIGGITWHDVNSNGLKELNEPALAGWQIQLRGADCFSTVTNAEGQYCFTPIPPGQYLVSEVVAPRWQQTFPAQSGAYEVVLQPNQRIDSLNFGNKLLPTWVEQHGAEDLPTTYFLFPNAPNPFNPSTKIKYALPAESRVRLEVFNMMGKRVAVLVDEIQAKGLHEAEFNGETLPSGLYLCKFAAPGFRAVKKMLLVQ